MTHNFVGFHMGNDHIRDEDWALIERMQPGVITFLPEHGVSYQDIAGHADGKGLAKIGLAKLCPKAHFIMRPYLAPSTMEPQYAPNYSSLPAFITRVQLLMDLFGKAIPPGRRHLQLLNEVNMPQGDGWEGFGSRVMDMHNFNSWFVTMYQAIKRHDPSWLIGWTPLTIGNGDCWFPGDPVGTYYLHGPAGCKESLTVDEIYEAVQSGPCLQSLLLADEMYSHLYVKPGQEDAWSAGWRGMRNQRYALFYPKKYDVWHTEFGFLTEDSARQRFDVLAPWLHAQRADETVKGVCLWILGSKWGRFWTRTSQQSQRLIEVAAHVAPVGEQLPDPPAPREPLPEDETATDAPTLGEKLRWWQEQAIRELEALDVPRDSRAMQIMYSQVRLHYRLEEVLHP